MTAAAGWNRWIEDEGAQIAAAGRWRRVRSFDADGPSGRLDDRAVVAFASNDYLGLSRHPAVCAAAVDAIGRWGTGSGASRLVVGSRPVHHDLEDALADWKGTERALLFPTGYAANLGVLATFGHAGARVLSDELNHASIVDGCRLARAPLAVFGHVDLDHLETLLDEDRREDRRSIVVTDAVFSMDGDVAPLEAIGDLCQRFGALLVTDEAHDVFHEADVLAGRSDLDLVRVGTLSKTLGSLGGFAATTAAGVDLLVNRARSFIFTTAPSPPDTAAALAALAVCRGADGDALRARLRRNIAVLDPTSRTPVLPVLVGHEDAAMAAAASLLEDGLFVPAIRPPTVPAGTSRLRVAVSADHVEPDLDRLAAALHSLGLTVGLPAAGAPGDGAHR